MCVEGVCFHFCDRKVGHLTFPLAVNSFPRFMIFGSYMVLLVIFTGPYHIISPISSYFPGFPQVPQVIHVLVFAIRPKSDFFQVDPQTPSSECVSQFDSAGRPLTLVFSDEFNVPGQGPQGPQGRAFFLGTVLARFFSVTGCFLTFKETLQFDSRTCNSL